MLDASLGYWLLFALLTAIVLAGVAAWIYQLSRGFVVTGLDQNTTWGVYTVDLVTFIGLSYGGALVSAILRLTGAAWRTPITRIAEATALVTLLIGAAYPIIHMGRPERVWRIFFEPRGSSPMTCDTFAILTYLIATIIFFYLALIPDLGLYARWAGLRVGRFRRWILRVFSIKWNDLPGQKRPLERALTIMSILIIPIAVYVHSVLAWAFSVTSRPGWHSTVFAPYFVVAALYSGVALVIVAVSIYRSTYRLQAFITPVQIRNLGFLLLTLGVLYAYFTFAEMLTEGYTATEEGIAILSLLLVGRYSVLFWGWIIGGLLVPVLLIALPWTRNVAGITTASVLVIVGMWIKRFLIVIPAMELSLISKEIVPYFPSWVELTLTAAGIAGIPWLLMIVFRFIPVLPVYDIEEEEVGHKEPTPSTKRAPQGGKLSGGA
jgi:molybdopterin-containing oxidoreductase family membrane subunit